MSRRAKTGTCTYCHQHRPLTRDHIPPRSLFPKIPPDKLITVPACKPCNEGFQKDDDYFWLNISLREPHHGDHEHATDAAQRALQHLNRPAATGARQALLDNTERTPVYTTMGLYAGTRLAYNTDLDRLSKTANRIITGLYYHTTKKRLQPPYTAKSRALDGFTTDDNHDLQTLLSIVNPQPITTIGDIFAYQYHLLTEDLQASIWLLTFYQTTTFIGTTLKQQDHTW